MLWIYVGTVSGYLVLSVAGAWLMWRGALRDGFVVRSVHGCWSRAAATKERAEKVAIAASLKHAPLVILDNRGEVVGTLGLD